MMNEKIRSQILEGSLTESAGYLFGIYRGYYVSVQSREGQYWVKINASLEQDVNNVQLAQFLVNRKNGSKMLLDVQVYMYMVLLKIKGVNSAKKIPEVLNEELMPVFQYLAANGYVSGCEQCGRPDASGCGVNGDPHVLCMDCRRELEIALQKHRQQKQGEKSNLVPGLVGAFLGSLIGCALWVLIGKLGYIAGIAGAVTGICAMKGYEMLGKHLDRKGVVGSVIIMVVMIYFANKISWAWEVYAALADYDWTFSECFRELGFILETSDLMGSYYLDLVIGYILTAACSLRPIISAFKNSGGDYTIK